MHPSDGNSYEIEAHLAQIEADQAMEHTFTIGGMTWQK